MRLAALLATTLADENRRRDEDCDVHNHIDPSEPRVERYVEREERANSHADRGNAGADHNGRARAALVAPTALVVGGLGHGRSRSARCAHVGGPVPGLLGLPSQPTPSTPGLWQSS